MTRGSDDRGRQVWPTGREPERAAPERRPVEPFADPHPMSADALATRARDLRDQRGGRRLHAAPGGGHGPLLHTAGALENVRRPVGSGCRPLLPAFVVAEVEAFLRCGILSHGLILAKSRDCGWCRPVAFSCRRRGFCPSCIGRRMSDFAAQLMDRVIPRVPIRQWVLSVPHGLRARMMFDSALTSAVLRELIRAISSWLRRRTRRQAGVKTGAVTVIQRFNSALGANPHFHTLFLDGVYTFPVARHPCSIRRSPARRRRRARCGRRVPPGGAPLRGSRAGCGAAALRGRRAGAGSMTSAWVGGLVATGPRRGRRIVRVRGAPADLDAFVMGRLCAEVEGFNLQAATRIHAW